MARPRSFALHTVGANLVTLTDRGERLRLESADYVVRRKPLSEQVKDAVGVVLGWVGRVVYAGPLLWLASLVAPTPYDGYLLVGFVSAAVAFFAVLNVFVVTSVVAYRAGKLLSFELDPPHRSPAPPSPHALPAPGEHEAPLAVGSQVSITGRVVGLAPGAEAPVLIDLWSTGEALLRLTEARPFAVCADGQMPVVLSVTRPPVLHAPPERRRLSDVMPMLDAPTRGLYGAIPFIADDHEMEMVTLRPGDAVRVMGVVTAIVEDVGQMIVDGEELSLSSGREGAPYREGERQRGLVVASPHDTSLTIERR